MKILFLSELDSIRGGGPLGPATMSPNMVSQPIDYGGADTGGGWMIEQSSLDSLQYQVDNGTDDSVTAQGQSLYDSAAAADYVAGSGAHNNLSNDSAPPSFWDIYNSIPGVPKYKVYKIKHGFKIC